jgi:hypothetical protein
LPKAREIATAARHENVLVRPDPLRELHHLDLLDHAVMGDELQGQVRRLHAPHWQSESRSMILICLWKPSNIAAVGGEDRLQQLVDDVGAVHELGLGQKLRVAADVRDQDRCAFSHGTSAAKGNGRLGAPVLHRTA